MLAYIICKRPSEKESTEVWTTQKYEKKEKTITKKMNVSGK